MLNLKLEKIEMVKVMMVHDEEEPFV